MLYWSSTLLSSIITSSHITLIVILSCVEGDDAGIPLRGLFIINPQGVLRQITMNDLPVGRSVDETIRLIQGKPAMHCMRTHVIHFTYPSLPNLAYHSSWFISYFQPSSSMTSMAKYAQPIGNQVPRLWRMTLPSLWTTSLLSTNKSIIGVTEWNFMT